MTELTPSLPDVFESNLPSSVKAPENKLFVTLLKYYYQWLTEKGQPTEFIFNLLQYRDIDLTTDEFREHLTNSLMAEIPVYSAANRTLLSKHISSFLKTKGSYDSFKIGMRAIYGQQIDMEWNSNKLFRPSANEFSRTATVVIQSDTAWTEVEGSSIVQTLPEFASAIIKTCTTTSHDNTSLHWLELDDKTVQGTFVNGSEVEVLKNNVDRSFIKVEYYYTPVSFSNNVLTFIALAEEERPYNNLIVKQLGSNFRAVIGSFKSRYIGTNQTQIELNIASSTGTFSSVNELYIIPASIESMCYTKDNFEFGIVSNSITNVKIETAGSIYKEGSVVKFISGSGINVDGYVAEVSTGGITTVDVDKKGFGYSVGDALSIANLDDGNEAAIVVVDKIDGIDAEVSTVSELHSLTIVDSGVDYMVNDEFELNGGTLLSGVAPAKIRVTAINSAWLFKGIKINSAGTGYPSYTKIALINTATTTKIANFSATPSFNENGGISSIQVTQVPTISVNTLAIAANGYGATAQAVITSGVITAINMTNVGVNYIDPIVEIVGNGTGAFAIANRVNDTVGTITVVAGGLNYSTATVIVKERNGSGFAAIPLIQDQAAGKGSISTVSILTRGDYTSLPSCFNNEVVNSIGTGFGAKFNLNFRLKDVKIENAGHFYQAITTSITGKGTGAELIPYIRDGVIVNVTKVSGGSGYTYANVFIEGTGFIGVCNLVGGAVDSITVLNGGYGYTLANAVTIVGDGVGASYNLTGINDIKVGVITEIYVKNGGYDYHSGTTITCPTSELGAIPTSFTPIIVDGVIKSVVCVGGEGYIESDLANLNINAGTNAVLTTTLSGNGSVVNYNVIDDGNGYFSQSEVTPLSITTGVAGSGAIFMPTLDGNGGIDHVEVLEGGSGYTSASTIIVSGTGSGAILKPVISSGIMTNVIVIAKGAGYKYGTSAIVLGDGNGALVTPIVETGITRINVLNGGSGYTSQTTVSITDTVGTGATAKANITDGVIKSIDIITSGTGYVAPNIAVNDLGGGVGAVVSIEANRHIKSLSIDNSGINYSYASLLIIGDGNDASFDLVLDKLGSIETCSVTTQGNGYVSTPTVVITDPSGYGAVSKVKIVHAGGGYKKPPILFLPEKKNISGTVIAGGTKFIAYGDLIGGVKRVAFRNHGAHYDVIPKPVFTLNAVLSNNAAFRLGEQVRIKGGKYHDTATTNYVLAENGDRLVFESGDAMVQDIDIALLEDDPIATVIDYDHARNIIYLDSPSDNFYIMSSDNKNIETEDQLLLVDEISSSFKEGDIIIGVDSQAFAPIKTLNRASGSSIVGGIGFSEFDYLNDIGKLNHPASIIADNNRYQDYAYVIKAGIALNTYEKLLKDIVHPAGFAMFGDVVLTNQLNLDILEEIGYNEIVTLVYLISISDEYQSGSEWTEMKYLFSDKVKFKFNELPISLVQDYTFTQTSDVLFGNYQEYYTPPLFTPNLTNWSVINGCQVLTNVDMGASGKNDLASLTDTSTSTTDGISRTATCSIGDTITLELFVQKKFSTTSFTRIELGTGYVNINLETGETSSSANTLMDMIELGNLYYIRLKFVATSTSVIGRIYPSYGTSTFFGFGDVTMTGTIYVSDVIMKNITGITPVNGIVQMVNEQYIPDMFYIADNETQINII